MSATIVMYLLTAVAGVIVVLTRLPLGIGNGAHGRLQVSRRLVTAHTITGCLGVLFWSVFLIADPTTVAGSLLVGIIGLGFWWAVSAIGLLMLIRWLPSRGRHGAAGDRVSMLEGPWPSVLAHLGMLVIGCVFTWAYLTAVV